MMQTRKSCRLGWLLSLVLLPWITAGCHHDDSGMSDTQKQNLDHTMQIVQTSGGDWSKVSDADRQFLIDGPGYGSEQTAQTYLKSEAQHLGAGPQIKGGPNPPGPPK